MTYRDMTLPVFICAIGVAACNTPAQHPAITNAPSIRSVPDFPWDPTRKHDRDFKPTGELTQLTDNLYLYEDCSNVYVVKKGDKALLVGFGSGAVLKKLPAIGVTRVEKVLITHHHRNVVQGLVDLKNAPFDVVAPLAEAANLENAEAFWRDVRLAINYNCRSHWNTARRNIQLNQKVADGDQINWRGIIFAVIHTPGATEGSISYAATLNGRKVVFCGDLIAGAGKAHNWFDLHWDYYGFTQGINASRDSFARVAATAPKMLLPSHGTPIENPAAAMEKNKKIYAQLEKLLLPNELKRQHNELRRLLPHLAFVGNHCYGIVSESGKALLFDYGYVERGMVQNFKKKFGVEKIDVVTFSHYHDDHTIRTHELFRRESPEIWIFEGMADVFENPSAYKLPCLLPFSIPADRVVGHREKVQWEEYELEFFYLPGQTDYHAGLTVKIDGRKVMFTGDNTWNKADEGAVRNGPVVPHNVYFLDGGFITCAQEMLDYAPDMVCPAHTEEYFPTREDLQGFMGWAQQVRDVMTELIDQPDPNFGMDYNWCRFYPYYKDLREGGEYEVQLILRNHLFKPMNVKLELKLPSGLECKFPQRVITVQAKKQVAVPFLLRKGIGSTASGRVPFTVDLTLNGKYIGEYAEGLVDL